MTELPPPPVSPTNTPGYAPPANFGATAVVSAIIGVIFLMVGWTFAQWLTHPADNPYGPITWQTGPKAGQAVTYFETEFGAAWRDFGQFATGAILLLEAACYAAIAARLLPVRAAMIGVLVLATLGCGANVLSAVMQFRAGFMQPIFALIGLAIFIMSAVSAKQQLSAR